MITKTPSIIVAVTTFDSDALRISLAPIARLGRKIILIVHNDNPEVALTSRMVRHMGWRGRVHIINSDKNVGELESRIRIVEYVRENNIRGDWITFVNDDDVLLDSDAPNIPDNVFAILYNATTISEKITDIFKISPSWTNGTKYGKTGPHFSILGTMVRRNIMLEYCDFLRTNLEMIYEFINSVKYYPPFDAMMWSGLNAFVHIRHPDMSPIYMDRTNYISIKMGRATTKYGRRLARGAVLRGAVHKFADIVENLASRDVVENMVA